ncbi:hypothetical protein DEU56DRAFT_760512 [Suillus clintonianus]|uniref:uncharacterized protein n=1 Tax=Suillus clintonianus TaxID=1904413 RepID=UPI001B86F7B9|nr:uncharacterized protein DEU56DRAFT_760512 [Suillus clintonianus]KAG2121918.1 hypothetical protein DEU56DRAFT_760512 [Suillus clintonianus]
MARLKGAPRIMFGSIWSLRAKSRHETNSYEEIWLERSLPVVQKFWAAAHLDRITKSATNSNTLPHPNHWFEKIDVTKLEKHWPDNVRMITNFVSHTYCGRYVSFRIVSSSSNSAHRVAGGKERHDWVEMSNKKSDSRSALVMFELEVYNGGALEVILLAPDCVSYDAMIPATAPECHMCDAKYRYALKALERSRCLKRACKRRVCQLTALCRLADPRCSDGLLARPAEYLPRPFHPRLQFESVYYFTTTNSHNAECRYNVVIAKINGRRNLDLHADLPFDHAWR